LYSYGIKKNLVQEVRSKNITFYLGLFRRYEWIERILEYNTREYEHQDHSIRDIYIKTSRKSIPKRIRNGVWDKHFKELKGECFCCSRELKFQDFECGHITPVSQGGSNDIDNLEPVCRMCNLDMGVMNLHSYKRLFLS
jgi:5-methylcytosine-specific restriction endonuclease McrA